MTRTQLGRKKSLLDRLNTAGWVLFWLALVVWVGSIVVLWGTKGAGLISWGAGIVGLGATLYLGAFLEALSPAGPIFSRPGRRIAILLGFAILVFYWFWVLVLLLAGPH